MYQRFSCQYRTPTITAMGSFALRMRSFEPRSNVRTKFLAIIVTAAGGSSSSRAESQVAVQAATTPMPPQLSRSPAECQKTVRPAGDIPRRAAPGECRARALVHKLSELTQPAPGERSARMFHPGAMISSLSVIQLSIFGNESHSGNRDRRRSAPFGRG